jgi:hypothetical protein
MREVKHCAFVVYYPDDSQRRIDYIYEVISIKLVKRKEITSEQAGVPLKNSDDNFWLFELGRVNKMELSIDVSGIRDFKFRLVRIYELEKANTWADLPNHYAFLQDA